MTPNNRHHRQQESHHGVLLNIAGNGIFIIGEAGIGKSSLALDFLQQGHHLIADDCVDFKPDHLMNVIGYCPPMLAGLLHTRELGLISLSDVFNRAAWQEYTHLNYVIRLKRDMKFTAALSPEATRYIICEQSFPMLTLDINTPATLTNRITTWLSMQSQSNHYSVSTMFKQRQHVQMGIP